VPDPRSEDFALARDPEPALAHVARVSGGIDAAELQRRRKAWLDGWMPRAGRWLEGHVRVKSLEFATDAAEAKTALAPPFALDALPAFAPLMPIASRVGRALWLADRAAEAVPYLERAVADCRAMSFPIELVRSWLLLGRARERTGDTQGACIAYGEVLRRWGAAKPASVSAREARDRSRALRCRP
jgi:serine/threonine-protein kinase